MGKILKPVSKISGIHGQPGEERVAQELANNLPDSYVILNSPRIHYKGETVDIDHIVIGPNGIFAIESKNMLGKITGGLMGNWTQEKRRAGKKIKIKIGNPSTQVNQYVKIIQTFLAANYSKIFQNKINLNIHPIVCFAFDKIDLSKLEFNEPGMVGRVRVLLLKELCQDIISYNDISYNTEEIENVADILIPEDQRDQTGIFSSKEISAIKEKFADRYELYEEIGRGNFAVVYRGFDFKLDREVAVKKLFTHEKYKDNIIKRFFREAQINAKLQHDNIVSIYDYYEENGECYLIMEFVEGETLLDFVNSKTLSDHEILEIMENICSAVQHAHELNIIHRDLKPANILINLESKVKVTDFGIARLTEGPMLTQTHSALGTPTIMAPEQITGKDVGVKTDIFSLGVLMYFMFTGEYPFIGEHIGEVIHKIIHLDPVLPSSINTKMPVLAEKIILKALEKDPLDRFQTVAEMRQAILYTINPDLCSDLSIGNYLDGKTNGPIIKILTKIKRTLLRNKKIKIASVTALISIVVILTTVFSLQFLYNSADSKDFSRAIGFNNENISLMYKNPDQYEQVPANIIGKIDRIVSINDNAVIFRISIQPAKNLKKDNILVMSRDSHFLYTDLRYIRVFGSLVTKSSPYKYSDTGKPEPVLIADKIDLIEDPWSLIAPAKFNLVLNKAIGRNGELVTIKKIEFTDEESRVFINVSNHSNNNIVFNLQKPKAKQGSKEYHEVNSKYGNYSSGEVELAPGKDIDEVIFLEPLNHSSKNATISFGTNKPYIFDLNWN